VFKVTKMNLNETKKDELANVFKFSSFGFILFYFCRFRYVLKRLMLFNS